MPQDNYGEPQRFGLKYDSADGSSTIRGSIWWTEDPLKTTVAPRAVVQLVHGMCEHIERYDDFARFLVGRGFLVCGHNHIGHGSSVARERRGCIPPYGRQAIVEDVERLRRLVTPHVQNGTPYFVFGHSMGSYVVRNYIADYGRGLAGAILCGTGFVPVATSAAGRTLARAICRTRGADHKSALLHGLVDGAFSKAVKDAKTPYDWISYNRENIERYLADEDCGFMFSAGGYAMMLDLTATTCSPACAQRVPHELPLLFVSGAEDPVGDNGDGVTTAADLAKSAGSTDVSCKLYPGMRHEILNEKSNDVVYEDILEWVESRIGKD